MKKAIIVAAVLCISSTVLAVCPTADLSGDCRVDFKDFAIMADQWMAVYDETDLAAMAAQWQTEGIQEIVWVSVNDSGAGMKDDNGNPISHGGFTGEMSKYETTNAQYCQYLNAAKTSNLITVYNDIVYAVSDTGHSRPYFKPVEALIYSQITYSGGTFSVRSRDGYSMANHPVVCVTWYGSAAYASYYGWRLPTEWEWQAVADYDGSYTYGCGTSIDISKANHYENGHANPLLLVNDPYTSPVGYYPAYGYGMCDMAGNAWEWTSSSIDSGNYFIICGGSWFNNRYFCTVSKRYNSHPYDAEKYIGFRVCR